MEDNAGNIKLTESLASLVSGSGLNPKMLRVGVNIDANGMLEIKRRETVFVSDKTKSAEWDAVSIESLFRGDAKPAPIPKSGKLPEKYLQFFRSMERSVLAVIDFGLHPFDGQFDEIYSQMRRRPDGKSLGLLHDIVWQTSALELGRREWSREEFADAFKILARSAKSHRITKDARNYIAHLEAVLSVRNITLKGA